MSKAISLQVGILLRHNKRGSTYLLIADFVFARNREVFADNQQVWIVRDSADMLLVGARGYYDFALPATMQRSCPYYDECVVYQCIEDHRIWARPRREFTTDRFTGIGD